MALQSCPKLGCGGVCFISPYQPVISSLQPKQSLWALTVEGCLLVSLQWLGEQVFQLLHLPQYEVQSSSQRTLGMQVSSNSLHQNSLSSFLLAFRFSSGGNQTPGHCVLQTPGNAYEVLQVVSWDKGKHSHHHYTSRILSLSKSFPISSFQFLFPQCGSVV